MKLSNFFLLLAFVGFISIVGFAVALNLTNVKPSFWTIYLVIFFALLYPAGMIGMKIASKKECKKGIHEPDLYGICHNCKKELPLTNEQAKNLEKIQRKWEKEANSKTWLIPVIISFVLIISMIVIMFLVLNDSNKHIIEGINSITLNSTNNNCLTLVQAKMFDNKMPFIDSKIKLAVDSKWNELDCDHQFIKDQLNNTCSFGEIPKIVDTGFLQAQFLCKESIGAAHK